MSQKTSPAALDSFGQGGPLTSAAFRATRPAEEGEVRKQRSKEKAREEGREFAQARIAIREEDVMNGNGASAVARTIRVILPVILRITFCLVMWTVGAITLTVTEAQTRGSHHVAPL